jgi:hypothetical protein
MQASRLTAIGGVFLAAAIEMIEVRLDNSWANGVHFAVSGVAFLLLFALALMGGGDEGGRPTAEQSALFVAALFLLATADARFGQVASPHGSDGAGTATWMAFLFAAIAAYPAVRRRSAVCGLAAGAAVGIGIVEFIDWRKSGSLQTPGLRWIFLGLMVLFALAAIALWRPRPRHAAQMVNLAMAGSIGILATIGFGIVFGDIGDVPHLSTWWEFVVLAAPLIAIAFAIRARERGPAWTGGTALALAIIVIAEPIRDNAKETLVGWPLVFLILAAVALVAGLAIPHRT